MSDPKSEPEALAKRVDQVERANRRAAPDERRRENGDARANAGS